MVNDEQRKVVNKMRLLRSKILMDKKITANYREAV
jgi:hypothetical protein